MRMAGFQLVEPYHRPYSFSFRTSYLIFFQGKEEIMLHTLDWQRVVHDPRFWSVRYYCQGDYQQFPGTTWKESSSWYKKLMEDEQDISQTDVAEEMEEGWTLSLSFPEGYAWQMDYSSEDEMDTSTYHSLHHPTIYPEEVYPEGAFLAIEGPDDHLPGLRWAELKQIGTCLARHWQGDFDINAIIPLLYCVVRFITFNELEDVRQTLATAWQKLQVLDASQVDQWLAQIITIYDDGQFLQLNEQKEWKPLIWEPGFKGDLWIREAEEWKTPSERSLRHIREDSQHFLSFFSMLERYS
jgi:hypothetical protein